MKKCKIIISDPSDRKEIIIDEEKNMCKYCGNEININASLFLTSLELIMASWDNDRKNLNGCVSDGVEIEVYFKDNENQFEYKFDLLSMPKNIDKLYMLLETLHD